MTNKDLPAGLDTGRPQAARIYDYVLGGKDNFGADREAAEAMMKASGPVFRVSAKANRRFMVRAGKYLAGERGLRQFLDFGTGLPTEPNLHQVVQGVHPDAVVVYVDNDPLVLVHARALLTSHPDGMTAYLDGDMRYPEEVFAAPELGTLDLSKPVAVTMLAVLQLIDDEPAHEIIDAVMQHVVRGSALALSAVVSPDASEALEETVRQAQSRGVPVRTRSVEQFTGLFRGLPLLEPGVVPVHRWRPDQLEAETEASKVPVAMWGGIAIKP